MKGKKSDFEPIINVTRNDIVENIHFGSYCITGKDGQLLYSYGNEKRIIYSRSTAKPFQALSVVLSGAYEKYKLTSKELAVISSSHFAEKDHIDQVKSILSKIGLNEEDLLTPFVYSRNEKIKEKQLLEGEKARKIFSDCSGKHAGMLAVCKLKGYPIENYINIEHPLQKEILRLISIIYATEDLKVGVDGCSAPVFAASMESLANSYLSLITCKLNERQKLLAKKYDYNYNDIEFALKIIRNAILENPEMIAGNDGLCTLLISIYGGSCIAKVGASGVYCLGLNDFVTKHSIGIAVKISDGSIPAAEFALMSILYRLNVLPSTRSNYINSILFKKNLNEHKNEVGKYIFLDDELPSLANLI